MESAGRCLVGAACLALIAGEAPAQEVSSAEAPEYIQEASRPYRGPPSGEEVGELLERWRADGGFVDPVDRIVGARLWRRTGDIGKALSLLTGLPEDGPVMALARYERARILFELTHCPYEYSISWGCATRAARETLKEVRSRN